MDTGKGKARSQTEAGLCGDGREGGFTLMELIVVCMLIGLMLTLTVPTMRDAFIDDPLASSARKVMGYVTGLRGVAVRTQQSILVHISEQENRIWYRKDISPHTAGKEGDVGLDDELVTSAKDLKLHEDVTINSVWIGGDGSVVEEQMVIWISKQGYMNHSMIQLKDNSGAELTVEFQTFIDSPSITDRFEIPSS